MTRRPRALLSLRPYSEQDALPLAEADVLAVVDVFCDPGAGAAHPVSDPPIALPTCPLALALSLFARGSHMLRGHNMPTAEGPVGSSTFISTLHEVQLMQL